MADTFANGGLRLERAGSVATLTLSRPKARNALSHAMWCGLGEIATQLARDDGVRALVITGAGDKAFSAGADIAEFPKTYASAAATRDYNDAVRRAQALIAGLPFPSVASIRGACFGGGCGLALHCDLRFASADARFAITPALLGLAYSFADTQRLVGLVGPARAKDILFSGRVLEAQEALMIGLIDRVLPPDQLDGAVADYVAGLAALSQTSIRVTKQTLHEIEGGAQQPGPALRASFEATFSGADFAEGYAAFMDKRKPDFS